MRIIPATVIVYVVAYMDRVNIGFAMAGGMNETLHLSALASGTAAGIFFWGYLLLQVPGGHYAEHRSPKRFIQWSIVAWAIISALTAVVRNSAELLVLRFLLGVAEGGAYPAILVLIGKWFTLEELGRANGLFLISLPLSAAISNPVSGWIVSHYSWRGLFLFEGGIAGVLLLVWLPLISDDPRFAGWLHATEREWLLSRKSTEFASVDSSIGARTRSAYSDLLGRKALWLMTAIYFCYSTAMFGFLFWLPSMIKHLTHRKLTAVGWLSAAPLLASAAGVFWFGALSDRSGNRRFYCAVSMIGFGLCFGSTLLVSQHMWACYALFLLAGLFSKAMLSPFWSMPAVLFSPGSSGGARGVINGIGNIGGFVGPVVVGWMAGSDANSEKGAAVVAAIALTGGMLTLLLPNSTAHFLELPDTANCQPQPAGTDGESDARAVSN